MLKTTTSPESIQPSSPFSQTSVLSSSLSQNNSPDFITSATYKKPTTKHVTQLSTSSAAGIAIASEVTPKRLAELLTATGPLAIRHITSNLSKQLQGFEKLSLSKQRRLIMSCLNQGCEENSIVFEKIGWGQWSAKKVDPDKFVKERDSLRIINAKVKDDDKEKEHHVEARRESISRNKYDADKHDKFLKTKQDPSNDFAILSDDEDDSSDLYDEEEEGVFKFEDEENIPPLKLNSRLISPPIGSSLPSSRRQSRGGITKPILKTKRSNSQTPNSPDLLYYSSKTRVNRRHSSIRSTLDTSKDSDAIGDDTDEEDWATIGANKLLLTSRNSSVISVGKTNELLAKQGGLKQEEQDAAFALVNLRSI